MCTKSIEKSYQLYLLLESILDKGTGKIMEEPCIKGYKDVIIQFTSVDAEVGFLCRLPFIEGFSRCCELMVSLSENKIRFYSKREGI